MFSFTIRQTIWIAAIGLALVGVFILGVRDGIFSETAHWFRENDLL